MMKSGDSPARHTGLHLVSITSHGTLVSGPPVKVGQREGVTVRMEG